ncbi:hypothetical protein D3C76_1742160 [compost metagenome]
MQVVHAKGFALQLVKTVDFVKNAFDAPHELRVDQVSDKQYFFATEVFDDGGLKASLELPVIADDDIAVSHVVWLP